MAEYHLSLWMGFNQAWNGDFEGPNPDGLDTYNRTIRSHDILEQDHLDK